MKSEYTDETKTTVKLIPEPGDPEYKKTEKNYRPKTYQSWWRVFLKGLSPVEKCIMQSLRIWGSRKFTKAKLARELEISRWTVHRHMKGLRGKGFLGGNKKYRAPRGDFWQYTSGKWWRRGLKGLTPVERCLVQSLRLWGPIRPPKAQLAREIKVSRTIIIKHMKILKTKAFLGQLKSVQFCYNGSVANLTGDVAKLNKKCSKTKHLNNNNIYTNRSGKWKRPFSI